MRTRPTQGLVREAIFNILGERIMGTSLLDLYAGRGGVGLYALERGAESVTFVEADRSNVRYIRERLKMFGTKGRVYHGDVMRVLRRIRLDFGLIFLDPPYNKGLVGPTLSLIDKRVPPPHTLIIAEHHHKEEISKEFRKLRLIKRKRYGETSLSIYEAVV